MHFMNPQRGRHMQGGKSEEHGEHGGKPHMFIHSHSTGHTVHVFHNDGSHEAHEHPHGDTEGMAEHIHNELGGEQRPENDGQGGEATSV
jgi:hypothetical protein